MEEAARRHAEANKSDFSNTNITMSLTAIEEPLKLRVSFSWTYSFTAESKRLGVARTLMINAIQSALAQVGVDYSAADTKKHKLE